MTPLMKTIEITVFYDFPEKQEFKGNSRKFPVIHGNSSFQQGGAQVHNNSSVIRFVGCMVVWLKTDKQNNSKKNDFMNIIDLLFYCDFSSKSAVLLLTRNPRLFEKYVWFQTLSL